MIVDFCYSGHINLTEDNVRELMSIASLAEFDLLEDECRKFYGNILSVTNAIDTWTVAEKHNLDLTWPIVQFVRENIEEMPKTEVLRMNHCLVQELLQQKIIGISGEMVFKPLMMWYESSEADRKLYMPELLQLFRLNSLSLQVRSPEFFVYRVFRDDRSSGQL